MGEKRLGMKTLKVVDLINILNEIGYDEKQAICALVEQYFPNDRYEVLKDLNGKDRMLFIYHNL